MERADGRDFEKLGAMHKWKANELKAIGLEMH